jgi:hypothetical protein
MRPPSSTSTGNGTSRASSSNSNLSNSNSAPAGAPTGARDRNGRQIIGTATPTTIPGGGSWGGGSFPGYPWYAPVVIGDIGYYDYGWWGYDYSSYYDSYGYLPYDENYAAPAGAGSGQSHARPAKQPTGAIRLKVNPETANVYVDGSLVGKATDFDGLLSHHLVLERGSHLLEIRADGYATLQKTLTVEVGKTMTERMTLQKK